MTVTTEQEDLHKHKYLQIYTKTDLPFNFSISIDLLAFNSCFNQNALHKTNLHESIDSGIFCKGLSFFNLKVFYYSYAWS